MVPLIERRLRHRACYPLFLISPLRVRTSRRPRLPDRRDENAAESRDHSAHTRALRSAASRLDSASSAS